MLCGLDLDSLPLLVTRKAGITDIPVRLLTYEILPSCEVRDMLSLGCTNKFFARIMSDDAFWRRKLVIDYNFTGSETNRTSGWKFIYLRLGTPRLFSWGCVTFLLRSVTEEPTHPPNCFRTVYRPVPKRSPKVALLEVPLPLETRLKNERFVNLAASEGLVQLPLQFDKTILTPYRFHQLTGRYTHSTLMVVFMSGVSSPLSLSSHAVIYNALR